MKGVKALKTQSSVRKSARHRTAKSTDLKESEKPPQGVKAPGFVNQLGHSFKKLSKLPDGDAPPSFPTDEATYFSGVVESRGHTTRYYAFPHLGGIVVFELEPGHVAYVSPDVPSYGVKATKSIKKGDPIGYYAGESRSTDIRPPNPYCLGIHKNVVVDALHCGNELRFINDPRESFEVLNRDKANVDISRDIYVELNGVRADALVATKDINIGDELLWSYGNSYWRDFEKRITDAQVRVAKPSNVSDRAPSSKDQPIVVEDENEGEISLKTFVKRYVKSGGQMKKSDPRKHFERMSPKIFESSFKRDTEKGTG